MVGCGNAYENVDVGTWQKVGSSQAPRTSNGVNIVLTPLRSGNRSQVQAGDLVKLVVVSTIGGHIADQKVRMGKPKVVWIWTGTEPESQTFVDERKWGSLGSVAIRRAVVGRNVGDQFEIRVSESSQLRIAYVPAYGFFVRYQGNSTLVRGDPYPYVVIAERNSSTEQKSEVEIVTTCPGQLYRRTAEVTQWGLWPGWGGTKTRTFRKGTLRWSALEAKCPAPDGNVRFEVGPLYVGAPHDDSYLQNWRMTYRRARPPEEFSQEYVERRD